MSVLRARPSAVCPRSTTLAGTFRVRIEDWEKSTSMSQKMISPSALVAILNTRELNGGLLIVCTPSKKVHAVGVTSVSGMFAPSGPRQRHHCRHEHARGVGGGRAAEWVAGV